ncbi:hypothetical protein ABZ953_12020 [Streptomyces sp. NPDC046465]|uniref:hypothetical protein n=1 Tax=Streptomyces sp. NPDC046465 TaxID=3155810 RepID=UPI003411B42D
MLVLPMYVALGAPSAALPAFHVLVAGVVTLAAGSALAGAGPTLSVVIVGRLIGGAGAGATVIAVFAAATALPPRRRRGAGRCWAGR